VADIQETGRGRKGRVWHSLSKGNLFLSLAVEVREPIGEILPLIPLSAGIAACDAIRKTGCQDAVLKWPNDVLVSGRKLAGILCEVTDKTHNGPILSIVGLGVNISASSFPEEIAQTATCLSMLLDNPPTRECIAADWIFGLEKRLQTLSLNRKSQIIAEWKSRAEPFGRRVRVGDLEGTTRDLTSDGYLIVMRDNGEEQIVVGGIVEQIDP
jgi:BirA family biotin operon repressor/biotin-[acetyl-CoA-carboxylase] ligase